MYIVELFLNIFIYDTTSNYLICIKR